MTWRTIWYSPRLAEAPWTRLRLHTERDPGRGVVEVAQALDVVAVVAVRVELAGSLEVRGQVVASAGMVGGHPLQRFDHLLVTLVASARSASRDELHPGRVPAGIGGVQAARNRAVPSVVGSAAAGVRVTAVETVLPLRQRGAIADRGVARGRGQRRAIESRRDLACNDRHRSVLVAGNDRLDAEEQRQVLIGVEVLDERGTGSPAPTASATCS